MAVHCWKSRFISVDVYVKGKLRNRETLARLSIEDVMFIAKSRLTGESPQRSDQYVEYAQAIEWAEAALM
jgi:hypothetical protein